MIARALLILAFACVATVATAQDESPLPPAGQLLQGASIFACAVEDRGELTVALFTFHRTPDEAVVLLTENGSLPAIEHEGRFVVFDPSRLSTLQVANTRSGALVDGVYRPMDCTNVSYDLRRTLRLLAQ